ncbi:uncharacterized protein H6S33_002071 [Morchella sextelata]|uniref:uncharacterized protein n=1 Tax=Morchella sextelata TaxID=1174677 RepID=UPI001D052B39|nr:uncharacterized protein H6S33_002071 [Morchella sextelata]KAH0608019.1 hypothetical protein H6S33_002071 [Morchella sextelata]
MVRTSTQRSTEEPQTQRPSIIRKRSMRGLLDVDGWKCNCNPRLPAVKCTVRNNGLNHGRRYYKCPNADTGCDLFLWETEAITREPRPDPRPLSQPDLSLPPTPSTASRRHTRANPNPENVVAATPLNKRRISVDLTSDTEPDSERDDEDVEPYMNWREPSRSSNGVATPRKQRRIDTQLSPSKSNNVQLHQSRLPFGPAEASSSSNPRDALSPHPALAPPPPATTTGPQRKSPRLHPEAATAQTPSRPHPSVSLSDNIPTTPRTNPVRRTLFGPRPRTPPPQSQPAYVPVTPGSRNRNIGSPGRGLQDTLIADTFKLLDRNGVSLAAFSADLRAVLMRHVMQKEGISQGRDTLRLAIARKDLEVADIGERVREVEGRNETLESENGRMKEEGEKMEEEVVEMRVRVEELEEENEALKREKEALVEEKARMVEEKARMVEEKARMLEEEKKMRAEMANLASRLGRVSLDSQTPQRQFEGVMLELDTAYLNIK